MNTNLTEAQKDYAIFLPALSGFYATFVGKQRREEYVEDYYYQIAAYSLAHKKQYGPITQGLICICTKDVIYQEFKMDQEKLKEYEDKWMERVTKYHETKATSEPVPQES